jgi:hypothetical protein
MRKWYLVEVSRGRAELLAEQSRAEREREREESYLSLKGDP